MDKHSFDNRIHQTTIDKLNYINEVKIFNEIQNSIIVFDFRKKEEFELSFISNSSINFPFNETPLDFLSTYDINKWSTMTTSNELRDKILRIKRYYIVIIMSSQKIKQKTINSINKIKTIRKESELQAYTSILFYQTLLENKVREIGVLSVGFLKFIESYPFLLANKYTQAPSLKINNFPSEIIDGRIYIGNQEHATNPEIINFLKITHIVNVTLHVKNVFSTLGIKYLNIQIDDTPHFKISRHFKKSYEFIDEALTEKHPNYERKKGSNTSLSKLYDVDSGEEVIINKSISNAKSIYLKNKQVQVYFKEVADEIQNDNRILIHCSLGVSRSPAITCMYLMKKLRLSYQDTMSIIKFHKDQACPIFSFVEELENFELKNYEFDSE